MLKMEYNQSIVLSLRERMIIMRSRGVVIFFRVLVAIFLVVIISIETFALTLMITRKIDYGTSFRYLMDLASYYYKSVFHHVSNHPEAQISVLTE